MKDILVSICCITYNHEHYIQDALDSFIAQKVNFPYEIVISDDCSKDNTRSIIETYKAKYPSLIKDVSPSQNIGSQANFIYVLEQARGKYIAICEGDDFWTDPLKLQKQVDILEADASLMACCTNSSLVDVSGNVMENKLPNAVVPGNIEGKYTLRFFFRQNHTYPTASMVFRRAHFDEVCAKYKIMQNQYLGDWTLWIAILCFGDMYYLDEVTCAYRINPTSVTHSKVDERRLGLAKANFKIIPAVASILPDNYQDIKDDLTSHTAWLWFNLANAYKHLHKYFKMAGCLFMCGIKDPKLLLYKLKNRKKH